MYSSISSYEVTFMFSHALVFEILIFTLKILKFSCVPSCFQICVSCPSNFKILNTTLKLLKLSCMPSTYRNFLLCPSTLSYLFCFLSDSSFPVFIFFVINSFLSFVYRFSSTSSSCSSSVLLPCVYLLLEIFSFLF